MITPARHISEHYDWDGASGGHFVCRHCGARSTAISRTEEHIEHARNCPLSTSVDKGEPILSDGRKFKVGDRARFTGRDVDFHEGQREGKVGIVRELRGDCCLWQIEGGGPGEYVTAFSDLTLEPVVEGDVKFRHLSAGEAI
jgi:hypothetical protein